MDPIFRQLIKSILHLDFFQNCYKTSQIISNILNALLSFNNTKIIQPEDIF
jgi:hypothetical protein